MVTTAERYHDISCGHRVVGHESACSRLHGHNYRVHFVVAPDNGLDDLGRVLDFSVIKSRLCMWLEDNWDHKFLAWEEDPLMNAIWAQAGDWENRREDRDMLRQSIVWVPFNPTAENMAEFLLNTIAPQELAGTGCKLVEVRIEETRKCSVTSSL